MVEDAIRVTPGTGIYHGRNPEDTFVAEPNRVGFTTFGACPNVIDPFTREVRQGTLEDTAGFARVCDYLDEIAVAERSVLAADVPDGMMFVLSIKEMLAIGRALMQDPELIMFDEPSRGLAPILMQDVFDIIKKLGAQGRTILLVEQNVNKALKIADYCYVLENGRIVHEGTGKELGQDPKVREAYLGI